MKSAVCYVGVGFGHGVGVMMSHIARGRYRTFHRILMIQVPTSNVIANEPLDEEHCAYDIVVTGCVGHACSLQLQLFNPGSARHRRSGNSVAELRLSSAHRQ